MIEEFIASELEDRCRLSLEIKVDDVNKAVTVIENDLNSKTYRVLVFFIVIMIISIIVGSFNHENEKSFKMIYATLEGRDYGFHLNTYLDVNNIKGIEVFKSSLGMSPILVIILIYLISFSTYDEYKKVTYKIYYHMVKKEKTYI